MISNVTTYTGTTNLVNKVGETIKSKDYISREHRAEIINQWALQYKEKFFEFAIHIIPDQQFKRR